MKKLCQRLEISACPYIVNMLVHDSLLQAGVQPTLDPSAETFISLQCASPGRGGELVGVCGIVRVVYGGGKNSSRREQLVRYF